MKIWKYIAMSKNKTPFRWRIIDIFIFYTTWLLLKLNKVTFYKIICMTRFIRLTCHLPLLFALVSKTKLNLHQAWEKKPLYKILSFINIYQKLRWDLRKWNLQRVVAMENKWKKTYHVEAFVYRWVVYIPDDCYGSSALFTPPIHR